MTDFISTARGAPLLARLVARLQTAHERSRRRRLEQKGLRELLAMDDDILRDIGVTRGDVAFAANLPAASDRSAELAKLTKRGDLW